MDLCAGAEPLRSSAYGWRSAIAPDIQVQYVLNNWKTTLGMAVQTQPRSQSMFNNPVCSTFSGRLLGRVDVTFFPGTVAKPWLRNDVTAKVMIVPIRLRLRTAKRTREGHRKAVDNHPWLGAWYGCFAACTRPSGFDEAMIAIRESITRRKDGNIRLGKSQGYGVQIHRRERGKGGLINRGRRPAGLTVLCRLWLSLSFFACGVWLSAAIV